jgi:hypothetical protein
VTPSRNEAIFQRPIPVSGSRMNVTEIIKARDQRRAYLLRFGDVQARNEAFRQGFPRMSRIDDFQLNHF